MFKDIAKWIVNGISQKIILTILKNYIKNCDIIDLFHNNGINFKNIYFNIENINNKITEIINNNYIEYCRINNIKNFNKNINKISINHSFITELSNSFQENSIIIKGLILDIDILDLKVKQELNLTTSQILDEDADFMDAADDDTNNDFENVINQYLQKKEINTSNNYYIDINKLHLLLEDINIILNDKNNNKINIKLNYFELNSEENKKELFFDSINILFMEQ